MNVLKFALAAVGVSAIAAAAPAGAVITTFATFSALNSDVNVGLVNAGNSNNRLNDASFGTGSYVTVGTKKAFVPGTVNVRFSFLQSPLSAYVTDATAAFTLNSTVAKNTPATGSTAAGFTQTGVSGSFSFSSTSAITVGAPSFAPHTYAAGSNLLSGSFTRATISGSGSSGSESSSNTSPMTVVTFSSDFLDFTPTVQRDLAFAITSAIPNFSKHAGANGALNNFRANMGGQFSSDPAPQINGLAIVPEPASWALMIAGFGLVGFASRRRSRVVAA